MSSAAVIEYVNRSFGVNYTISGMTELLIRLGFSYKKPQAVHGKADGEAQRDFLKRLSLKSDNNPMLYVDGVHPQHNSHPDYGWLPKGEKVPLKTNAGRKRVTINGALDAESKNIFVQEDDVLNAQNTIKFFQGIELKYPEAETIYVILDNAGYYRGAKLQEYIASSKIELIHLPPYSPNLNLIERVWKFFKKKVLANRYYDSYLEFKSACLNFFQRNRWDSYRNELDSLLTENFQIIDV